MERLKGWRAGPWAAGVRAPNTLDSKICTKALIWVGPAGGPAKPARRGSLPHFPGSASHPLPYLHPQPSEPEGAQLALLDNLPGVSGAGRAASGRKGVPGLGAEEGVAQGKQEMPGGRNRGVQRSLDRSSADHRGRLIRTSVRRSPPLRTAWVPPSLQGGAVGRGSAYTRGCWGPPNGLARQGQGEQRLE